MTVFKGYLLMAKKNVGRIVLYFGIFTLLALLVASDGSGNSVEKGFSSKKMKILVVDEDESELSSLVTKYLKAHHEITEAENDKKALYEELYYQKKDLVIYLPQGMEKNIGKGKNVIQYTQSPGSFSGMYLEQQLSQLMAGILDYQNAGYSMEEAYQKMMEAPKGKVSVMNRSKNQGEGVKYSNFFRCVPYMFIAGLGEAVALIIFSFRKKEVKNRMMASSVSLFRQNMEGVLAVFLVGMIMYAVTILLILVLYGADFFFTENLFYYLLNLFLNMLLALAMAFMLGMLIKRETVLTMCFTSLSLAFSFLGGVFVALKFLSPEMRTVAKFIPVYWYEVVNDLLMGYSKKSETVKMQIWQSYGMQLLFVAAIFSVGLVIAKRQQQES